jgi:ornithine cyclodeaminase/alanine dehydrogenase-like protein (mu-crystallin family)
LFDLAQIKIHDRSKTAVDRLINSLSNYKLKECSIEEVVASDIVCTLTPSKSPILKEEWIKPGTHINAVGADAEGKEELEPSILDKAMVVVDDLGQASTAGEINVPVSNGLYKVDQVYATLSEIILGKKKGRPDDKAITIFDSTGIAIEDIATAKLIYEKASLECEDSYVSIDLV